MQLQQYYVIVFILPMYTSVPILFQLSQIWPWYKVLYSSVVDFSFKDDFSGDWRDVSVTKCAYCSCKRLDINSYHPHGVTTTTCNYSSKGIKHLWPPEHTETHEHLYTNKTEIKLIFFSPLKPLFLCCLDLYFLINMLSIFNKKQYVSLWHFLYIHNIHTWLL